MYPIDLTKAFNEPRSAHEQLAGVKLLARLIDKGRATITGMLGPYLFFDCALDRIFFDAVNVSQDEFLEVLRQACTSRLSYNMQALADLRESLECEPEISDEYFMTHAIAADVDNATVHWLFEEKGISPDVLAAINAAVESLPPEAFIDRMNHDP